MANLQQLNKDLADKSYIGGFLPSHADIETLTTLPDSVDEKKFPNVARWARHIRSFSVAEQATWAATSAPAAASDSSSSGAAKPADDEDVDLFGSDDDDDAAQEALREKFLAESEAKKKAKGIIAKSSILFDVKPLDDETNLAEMERLVREITLDGLEWKAGKLEDVAYGIQKLVINCHVEDDKVSTDILEEKIMELEDFVQSVDVAAFNKL